ncbi:MULTISPECIES: hypothetical protein [unclassified Geodermatophilus]
MTPVRARWLGWSVCAVTVALAATAAVVDVVEPDGTSDPWSSLPSLLAAALVGALIAARLPTNPYGWVVSGCALVAAAVQVVFTLGRGTDVRDDVLAVAETWGYGAFFVLFYLVLVLFPTGRLPGRGWRWFPWAAGGLAAAQAVAVLVAPRDGDPVAPGPWPVGGAAGRVWDVVVEVSVYGALLLGVVAALAPVLRYRRAGPVQRQQLKWLAVASSAMAASILLDLVAPEGLVPGEAYVVLDQVAFTLVPVGIGIALLRYRLFDIDHVLSRTVSYTLLTAGLVALYVGAVTGLRALLAPVTGSSEPAVVASTLAVAAAFRPARRRVQDAVDRRFDRARYDAARQVDAYARRLRTDVDLETVVTGLRETVTATVGPQRMALWLRNGPAGSGTST